MLGSIEVSNTEFIVLGILSFIMIIAAFLFFRKNDSDIKLKDASMRIREKGLWKSLSDVDRNKD